MLGLKHLVGVLSIHLSLAAHHDGPIVVGQTFLAQKVDPTYESAPWALTSHGIAEKLFTVNQNDEIVGQVGESVSKITDLVWEVTLKSGVLFSDGTAMNAQHVADCLNEVNTKNSNAQSSLGIMTVVAEGEDKVRIESERTTHVMDAVLAEWAFAIFARDSNDDFVFTGPYKIENYAPEQIDLIPNEHYRDGLSTDRPNISVKKFSDAHELAEGVSNHEIDVAFHLPIDTLAELRQKEGVHIRSFEVGYHYMTFYNLDSLTDVRVRQAIDLAIDRTALSQILAGGTGTRSLFPDYSPYYSDDSDLFGDSDAAAALLDEAGWVLVDGKRMKDGEQLTIRLVSYPHRPGLGIMQPVIADSLTQLGITVDSHITGQEWDETATIIKERSFDMLLWAQHTLPAGDPLWFLSSFFRTGGGNNHSNLGSSTVDDLLDVLSITEDHSRRVAASGRVLEAIAEEMPVSNLVTPFWHVGLSDRMQDYEPWGSDYYVIRDDLHTFVAEEMTKEEPGDTKKEEPTQKPVEKEPVVTEKEPTQNPTEKKPDEEDTSGIRRVTQNVLIPLLSALVLYMA